MKIEVDKINNWGVAKKTRPIRAKPLVNLLVDKSVVNKFLVDTLEGREPLGDGVVICVGEAGDTWQQMPNKLLKKYSVVGIDKDGWMQCEPMPDNASDCVEITSELVRSHDHQGLYEKEGLYIIGLWGETVGEAKNVQRCEVGDFILRNREDHTDVWIVRRKLFLNTYNIIN